MKRKPIKMTLDHAKSLIDWIEKNKGVNWGSWSEKPKIGVGATYLSYDRNPMQINLDNEVELGGIAFRCISESSSLKNIMGKKNLRSYVGIEGFKELYYSQMMCESMDIKGSLAEGMPSAYIQVFKRGKQIAEVYPDVEEEIINLLGMSAEYIDQGEDPQRIIRDLNDELDYICEQQKKILTTKSEQE